MKDFSRDRERKTFRIDNDVFEAAPAIPAGTLVDFATRFGDLDSADAVKRLDILTQALNLVLLPDSFKLLTSRMRDKVNPIEIDQLSDVIVWLLGEYGLRPTQPFSESSDGQPNPESGTNLTAPFLPGESISILSPPIAS